MPQTTYTREGILSHKGEEAGKGAKYDEVATNKLKTQFNLERGYGIGKMPKDYEDQFKLWREEKAKKSGQVKALSETPKK